MKRLKSTCADLDEIAGECMLVRHIAEPLASFDDDQNIETVRLFMDDKSYDAVGVRIHGSAEGYVLKEDLANKDGPVGAFLLDFSEDSLIDEFCGIKETLERLRRMNSMPLFVTGRNGHVWGVVTRGDLRKAPVSMYLFSLISLLEMQLTRIIQETLPQNSWQECLNVGQLKKVTEIFSDRRRRNEHVNEVDCLQFAHKKIVIKKSEALRKRLGFSSNEEVERVLSDLEELRNNLAHGQDVIAAHWPKLVDLVQMAEGLLRGSEQCIEADR